MNDKAEMTGLEMHELYSLFCEERDLAFKSEDATVKAGHLARCVEASSVMIGRLAWMGEFLNGTVNVLGHNVDHFAEIHPEMNEAIQQEFNGPFADYLAQMNNWNGEADFCLRFVQAYQRDYLKKVGIDPGDVKTANRYLKQRGRLASLQSEPPNAGN